MSLTSWAALTLTFKSPAFQVFILCTNINQNKRQFCCHKLWLNNPTEFRHILFSNVMRLLRNAFCFKQSMSFLTASNCVPLTLNLILNHFCPLHRKFRRYRTTTQQYWTRRSICSLPWTRIPTDTRSELTSASYSPFLKYPRIHSCLDLWNLGFRRYWLIIPLLCVKWHRMIWCMCVPIYQTTHRHTVAGIIFRRKLVYIFF